MLLKILISFLFCYILLSWIFFSQLQPSTYSFYFISMNLSQSYDSGRRFNIFTWVDLGYFLGLIFLINFFISSFDIELVENWASWFFFFNLLSMELSKFFNSSYRSVGWPDFAPFLPFFNWASYFFYLLSMKLF